MAARRAITGRRLHRPDSGRQGQLPMSASTRALSFIAAIDFWRRAGAMMRKEFLQLRRDRITFATMITIPLIQLTKFFRVTEILRNNAEFDQAFASGRVLFAVEIPANFERALRRGDKPALLVAVDASDPVATGNAVAALSQLVNTALVNDHGLPDSGRPLFEIRTHQRYNPAAVTALNIVPGLLGTILTLTMLIFTALSVTREVERGTMESLLAMPITPLEIMV